MAFNMRATKNPMPTQAPEVRRHNFDEVARGYTEEMAIDEAKRCMQCKNPGCVPGCPVHINIPAFIAKIAQGEFEEAYQIITQSSSLPAVCGRVCPQESQCEKNCLRAKMPVREKDADGKMVVKGLGEAVGIGRLERFVADYHREHVKPATPEIEKNGHKVAIIGSGPSGLACAYDLAKAGYDVTMFEALHVAGGVLMYGIPEFRLPKAIVQNEIEGLKRMGVTILTDMVIGRVLSIDELMKEYHFEACFVGTGAGLPRFLGIPGENAKGVYSANEFLTRVNLMKAYQEGSHTPIEHAKNVVVVGGGNVAMDACRTPLRLGAKKVTCVYRRSKAELPARKEEVEHAEEEGVVFDLLRNPVEILEDRTGSPSPRSPEFNPNYGCVTGIRVQKQKLGEPDASGRRRPVPVSLEEDPQAIYTIPCDCVIIAIGTSPNPLIKATTPGIETNPHGCLIVNEETNETTKDGVFAGGDAVTGAATVILAMGAGRKAAKAIDEYLQK
ncbi:MAG: NADPH-dependent glutamate synthase [Eubacteriales bacterium]|nr:NADPH-dependent glutamate synthase [Eubacteriales bacterium]